MYNLDFVAVCKMNEIVCMYMCELVVFVSTCNF